MEPTQNNDEIHTEEMWDPVEEIEEPEEDVHYETTISLLDEPVFSVIPLMVSGKVRLVLEKYGIPYQEQDEWSREMMLHEIPRTAIFHGNKVRGLTIFSKVPQTEIDRIAEEVEGLLSCEIATKAIRDKTYKVEPKTPENTVLWAEMDEDGVVIKHYQDGHISMHG